MAGNVKRWVEGEAEGKLGGGELVSKRLKKTCGKKNELNKTSVGFYITSGQAGSVALASILSIKRCLFFFSNEGGVFC